MSYQSRSRHTDNLLLAELAAAGFDVQTVKPSEQHPVFQAPEVISVFRIVRMEGSSLRCQARETVDGSRDEV
jgi:hypothetical protein